MTTYTITLSAAETKALGVIAISQQEWIDNAVHERCRIAIEEIVAAEVQRKLAANETISGSKEEIVLAASIKSAAERQTEMLAQMQQG
jgi:beta-lactamase class D